MNFNYSSLRKISLRQAIEEFTGLEPEILTFTRDMINEDDLWTTLYLLFKNGGIIGIMARELAVDLKENNKKVCFFVVFSEKTYFYRKMQKIQIKI